MREELTRQNWIEVGQPQSRGIGPISPTSWNGSTDGSKRRFTSGGALGYCCALSNACRWTNALPPTRGGSDALSRRMGAIRSSGNMTISATARPRWRSRWLITRAATGPRCGVYWPSWPMPVRTPRLRSSRYLHSERHSRRLARRLGGLSAGPMDVCYPAAGTAHWAAAILRWQPSAMDFAKDGSCCRFSTRNIQ